MKKSKLIIAVCAAAVVLSSCSSGLAPSTVDDCFLRYDAYSDDCVRCLICKAIRTCTNSVDEATDSVETLDDAEHLAQRMMELQFSIEVAKVYEIDVPRKATKVYNNALACIREHNYFNSDTLREELSSACPL